jgi:hypothetical protein
VYSYSSNTQLLIEGSELQEEEDDVEIIKIELIASLRLEYPLCP